MGVDHNMRNTNGVLNGSEKKVLWYVLKSTMHAVHVRTSTACAAVQVSMYWVS